MCRLGAQGTFPSYKVLLIIVFKKKTQTKKTSITPQNGGKGQDGT